MTRRLQILATIFGELLKHPDDYVVFTEYSGNKVYGTKNSQLPNMVSAQKPSPSSNWEFADWQGSGNGAYSGTSNPAGITLDYPVSITYFNNALRPCSHNIICCYCS